MFEIRFTEGAVTDLDGLRPFERIRIVEEIGQQLAEHPDVESARRKLLVGLVPPFEHVPPIWQLRVGEFRVFYDVDGETPEVVIRAVRRKGRQRTEEIL